MSRRRDGAISAMVRLACVVALLAALAGWSDRATAAELIMFDEAGCSWCRRWDKEVGQAYPRSEEGQRAPLRRFDISRSRNAGVGLAAPVTVTPTFVLVDGGVEVGRITGYPGADFFWGLLGGLVARLAPATTGEGARDAGLGGRGRTMHTFSEPMARLAMAARGG